MNKHEIITFVFSDIEGSTQLAQKLKGKYPEILEHHRWVIRDIITEFDGSEIDTAGDGVFMIFKKPANAILSALEIQKKFHAEKWATEIGLKVRMGIHTGLALPTESGYTGVEVHCASRICSAAYGGQVLISNETKSYLDKDILDKMSISNLGDFVFKDFNYPIELFQLNIPGVKNTFPEPRIEPNVQKIAILPFTIESQHAGQEYIGYGIAEELIIALGKVKGLRVSSRSSSFAFTDSNLSVKEIGVKLNVSSVLDGRILSLNGTQKITVELVESTSGLNLWSRKYDSPKDQIVSVQDDIIQNITNSLKLNLLPEQFNSIQRRQTFNAEAYDFYLRGRRFYLQFSNRGIELAIKMFNKAIAMDQTYALAYAGIAVYSYQYQHKLRSKGIIEKANKASLKAVNIAPDLAEVYVSRGIVLALREKYQDAEKSFQHAIEMDPTLFLGWFHFGRMCFSIGRFDKAARLFEQANRVEPDDYQSILLSAQSYDAIDSKDLAQILRIKGVKIAENWIRLNPGDTRALYFAANALVSLGQKERSLDFLKQALSLEPNDSMLLYNAACVYALLEMKQEALSCVEKSYAAGLTLRGWYENDTDLDSIRNEPKFINLLAQMQKKSN